ncbi:hypothetical protein GCM10020254_60330 [Streptomyces goshikiensis]
MAAGPLGNKRLSDRAFPAVRIAAVLFFRAWRRGRVSRGRFPAYPEGDPWSLPRDRRMRRTPVPLSEHEQRMLEQMERALYAEDPKFATALEG